MAIMLKIISQALIDDKILWSAHAERERFHDNLSVIEILDAIHSGDIIEQYDDDKPLPSCLMAGKSGNKNIHAVIGYNADTGYIRIITVYIPDPELWDKEYKRRTR